MDLQSCAIEMPMPEMQRIALLQRAEYMKRLGRSVQTSAAKLIEEAEALTRDLKSQN